MARMDPPWSFAVFRTTGNGRCAAGFSLCGVDRGSRSRTCSTGLPRTARTDALADTGISGNRLIDSDAPLLFLTWLDAGVRRHLRPAPCRAATPSRLDRHLILL